MIFFGVIIFCMAIVHSPLVHAETTESANEGSRATESISEVNITLSREWQRNLRVQGYTSMTVQTRFRTIDLTLRATDPILVSEYTPVYLIRRDHFYGTLKYIRQRNDMKNVGQLLDDVRRKASVIINTDEDHITEIVAIIGGNETTPSITLIRASPKGTIKKRDTDSITIPAVVKKLEDTKGREYAELIERGKREIEGNGGIHKVKRDSTSAESRPPAVLYPKIILATDSTFYPLSPSKKDFMYSLRYVIALFNTITLHFRYLGDTEIQFHIAAITIETEEGWSSLPRLRYGDFYASNDTSAYFYNLRQGFPSKFDIVFALTRSPMAEHTIGKSRYGAACSVSNRRMNAIVSYHDSGNIRDFCTAIHELGYLFGMQNERKWPKDCFKSSCLSRDEPTFPTDSQFGFMKLLSDGTFSCMYEKPDVLLDFDGQCRSHNGRPGCVMYEDQDCSSLKCEHLYPGHAWVCEDTNRTVTPGTLCKISKSFGLWEDGFCHDGHCVSSLTTGGFLFTVSEE